ncbi:MAG TPA: hypothetical protein VFT54_10090, partial [Acidimicrobiia bacterium]|nr:hypothetical protein [Acidimicrobiia bacterium]
IRPAIQILHAGYNQGVTQTSASVARSVVRQPRKFGGLKMDLLPLMALLGAVYGWVVAVLAVIIAAIVLLIG